MTNTPKVEITELCSAVTQVECAGRVAYSREAVMHIANAVISYNADQWIDLSSVAIHASIRPDLVNMGQVYATFKDKETNKTYHTSAIFFDLY